LPHDDTGIGAADEVAAFKAVEWFRGCLRHGLRWSVKELADKADVAESTIKRMEQDEGFPIARSANIEAVYRTLAEAGIIFLPENGGGVGIRLRKIS
jgi:hypothetical protein